MPAFLAPLVEDLESADAFELHARLRRALRFEQRLLADMGPLLLEIACSRAYRAHGCSSLATGALDPASHSEDVQTGAHPTPEKLEDHLGSQRATATLFFTAPADVARLFISCIRAEWTRIPAPTQYHRRRDVAR